MDPVPFPPPTYSKTSPARPRIKIPASPPLTLKPLSAPAQQGQNHLVTPMSMPMTATNISPNTMPEPIIHPIHNAVAKSWTYLVADPVTEQAIIIDPTLDYDARTSILATKSADKLLDLILVEGYNITFILETRLHKSHISAAAYLQGRLRELMITYPKICMGAKMREYVGKAGSRLSTGTTPITGENGYFDRLFDDYDQFRIGNIVGDVVSLPMEGSEENVGYFVGVNIFTSVSTQSPASKEVISQLIEAGEGSEVMSSQSIDSSVTGNQSQSDTGEGWRRLMNLPPLCRVYGGTGQVSMQPWLTYDEMRVLHDKIAAGGETPSVQSGRSRQSKMEFYATQINMRGGRIPSKINMPGETNDKGKGEAVVPLRIGKKLAGLMC